jgi:hypothetical protein
MRAIKWVQLTVGIMSLMISIAYGLIASFDSTKGFLNIASFIIFALMGLCFLLLFSTKR